MDPASSGIKWEKLCSKKVQSAKIRKVFLSEEGEGDFPQPFRQCNTAHAAFRIGGKISGVILEVGCQQDQSHTENTAYNIEGKTAFLNTAVHQIAHHAVQQPNREHKRDILQNAGEAALD